MASSGAAAASWATLDRHVMLDALGFLNAYEVTVCERVCKHWREVASDKAFWGELVLRRFHTGPEKRRSRLAATEERRNWKVTYREWLRRLRMPRSPLTSRFNIVFGVGSCVARAAEDDASASPRALCLSGWVTVVHTADLRLVAGDSHRLRLRLMVQNAAFGVQSLAGRGMSTAQHEAAQATSPVSITGWTPVSVLVSTIGARLRTKDGAVVAVSCPEGPPIIAVNRVKLSQPTEDEGAAPHVHDGPHCACGKAGLPPGGVLSARAIEAMHSPERQAAVVLDANDFAVIELCVSFPSESAEYEPEALEQLECLEVQARRADGVGQSVTLSVPFAGEAFIWEQYVHIPGGAYCLKEEAASAAVV
jgi:hypothetical protein